MEEIIRQIFVDELGCEAAALSPECRLREDLGVSWEKTDRVEAIKAALED